MESYPFNFGGIEWVGNVRVGNVLYGDCPGGDCPGGYWFGGECPDRDCPRTIYPHLSICIQYVYTLITIDMDLVHEVK